MYRKRSQNSSDATIKVLSIILRLAHYNIIIIRRCTRKIVLLIPMYSVFHHILFLYYAREVLTLTPVLYVWYSVVNEPALVAFRPPESERIILSPPPLPDYIFSCYWITFIFSSPSNRWRRIRYLLLRALFICCFHFFSIRSKSFVVTLRLRLIPIYCCVVCDGVDVTAKVTSSVRSTSRKRPCRARLLRHTS